MIDDRLREIVLNHHVNMKSTTKRVGDISGEAIAEIHQAFADEGYFKQHTSSPGAFAELSKSMSEHLPKLMSGKEWYERFLKEWRAINLKSYSTGHYAKMAAKRASGIERKEQQA